MQLAVGSLNSHGDSSRHTHPCVGRGQLLLQEVGRHFERG